MNHGDVDRCLKKLEEMDLVTEKKDFMRIIKPAFDTFTILFKRGRIPEIHREG